MPRAGDFKLPKHVTKDQKELIDAFRKAMKALKEIDDSTLQKYERWRVFANKNRLLINPTANDWWETSKAIRRLYLMAGEQQSKTRLCETTRVFPV